MEMESGGRKLKEIVKGKLSVIVPTILEWPQMAFTLRNIHEELRDRVDHEIICIDNWCDEVKAQGRTPDRGHEQIWSMKNDWLKPVKYDKRLSHWQAKKAGIEVSDGEFLWFCDAHCIVARNALYSMLQFYKENHEQLNGSIHLPLTYHILESHRLIYKAINNLSKGWMHYSFSGYPDDVYGSCFEVPAMSTCGMMVSRKIYDEIGGWPESLGIYGGGENFFNYVLSIMGMKKYIMCGNALHHHGDKRGYSYNYDDMITNRATAMYMVGGEPLLNLYVENTKGKKVVLEKIKEYVIRINTKQRKMIESKQQITIHEWCKSWEGKPRYIVAE